MSRMLSELHRRGGERTEAGCFVLGTIDGSRRRARTVIYYDDLDPMAYRTGGIALDGRIFGEVWRRCRELGMSVVCDVHTHPGVAKQSSIDEANPAVRQAGHVAIIVPDFARRGAERDLGVFEYLGDRAWRTVTAREYVEVGWWV